LKGVYLLFLKPCVRFPWLVVLIALGALGAAGTLVPLIGTEFLPALDEGSIAVQTFRIPSISLPQSWNCN
jgi:cobalt-zinc-cadmium resistance protein CzcA